MPTALRVCSTPGCPTLVAAGRCVVHGGGGDRNHTGVPPSRRGHGADYRRARADLLGRPCHWCGTPADTADYAVPYSLGGTLADLVPACARCNYSRAAGRGGRIPADGAPRVGPRPSFFRLYGSPSRAGG